VNLSSLFPINLPAEADVKSGVTYGRQLEKTGALAVKDPASGIRMTDTSVYEIYTVYNEVPCKGDVDLTDLTGLTIFGTNEGYVNFDSVRFPSSVKYIYLYTMQPSVYTPIFYAGNCSGLMQLVIQLTSGFTIDLPATVNTPADLLDWIFGNGNGMYLYNEALLYPAINDTGMSGWGSHTFRLECDCVNLTSIKLPRGNAVNPVYMLFDGSSYPGNVSLDIPSVFFCDNFWSNIAHSSADMDELLVALVAGGASYGVLTAYGADAPGVDGQAAILTLETNGWTIEIGY